MMDQAEVMRERGPDRVSPFLIPMMISDSAAGVLAIRLGVRGPNMSIGDRLPPGTTRSAKHLKMIRRGAADVMSAPPAHLEGRRRLYRLPWRA